MVMPRLISVRLQPNSFCNGSMKKPMVLNGNGEAPKAVPTKLAAKAFQPRLNSPPDVTPGSADVAFWLMVASIPAWE